MNEIICKRKSIRKYDPVALDKETLAKVGQCIETVNPLYPDIKYSIEFAVKTKGMFNIKAPHYLVFGSEQKEGANENIGFIGQQLDLFLSEIGLGACWLGVSKPDDKGDYALPCIICMSFGKPAEPLHRDISEFKRKPLSEIIEGVDKRLEAARLAPSGMNKQNWFFAASDGHIHCYRKKFNPLVGLMFDNLTEIDMGIALCHIAEESDNFVFSKEQGAPSRSGYIYMGTVR